MRVCIKFIYGRNYNSLSKALENNKPSGGHNNEFIVFHVSRESLANSEAKHILVYGNLFCIPVQTLMDTCKIDQTS